MRDANEQREFLETLARLFVAFPQREQGPEQVALRATVYAEALEAYRVDEIKYAVREFVQEPERVWLPTPGELIGVMNEQRRARRFEAERVQRDEQAAKALEEPYENVEKAVAAFKKLVADLERKMRWGGDVPPQ